MFTNPAHISQGLIGSNRSFDWPPNCLYNLSLYAQKATQDRVCENDADCSSYDAESCINTFSNVLFSVLATLLGQDENNVT